MLRSVLDRFKREKDNGLTHTEYHKPQDKPQDEPKSTQKAHSLSSVKGLKPVSLGQNIKKGKSVWGDEITLIITDAGDMICDTSFSEKYDNLPRKGEKCFEYRGIIIPDRQNFFNFGQMKTREEFLKDIVDTRIEKRERQERKKLEHQRLEEELREKEEKELAEAQEARKQVFVKSDAIYAEETDMLLKKLFDDAHTKYINSVQHILQNDRRFPYSKGNPVRIAFIGDKISGKSRFINSILGKDELKVATGYGGFKWCPTKVSEYNCPEIGATLIYTPGNFKTTPLLITPEEKKAICETEGSEHGYINGEFIKLFKDRAFDMAILTIAPFYSDDDLKDPARKESLQKGIFDDVNEVMLKILMAANKPFIITCAIPVDFRFESEKARAEEQIVLQATEQTCKEKIQKTAVELGLKDFDVSKVKILYTFEDRQTKELKLSSGGDMETIKKHIKEVMQICKDKLVEKTANMDLVM